LKISSVMYINHILQVNPLNYALNVSDIQRCTADKLNSDMGIEKENP